MTAEGKYVQDFHAQVTLQAHESLGMVTPRFVADGSCSIIDQSVVPGLEPVPLSSETPNDMMGAPNCTKQLFQFPAVDESQLEMLYKGVYTYSAVMGRNALPNYLVSDFTEELERVGSNMIPTNCVQECA